VSTSVYIVDDHPIFRRGLREVIESAPRLKLVGDAADGPSALAEIRRLSPAVAVLDVELPGMDGLTLAREVRKLRPPPAVILLTMCKEERVLDAALEAGVLGYVLKDNAITEVLEAIQSAARGDVFLSPSMAGHLVRRRQRQTALAQQRPELRDLTPMERRVLKLTAQGMSCKEIASELFISYRTVETHRNNVARKLDLRGDHRLLQFAIEHRAEL
jgi:DNA-binding NarL/FixJ family response regulator